GWEVVALDNMSAGEPLHKWHDPVSPHSVRFASTWDIRCIALTWDVRRGVATMGHPDEYDLIIHCAAIVGGRLKIDNAPFDVAVNLEIDAAFFRWVIGARPSAFGSDLKPKVIYFSSSAVYPVELQQRLQYIKLAEPLVTQGATRFGRPDSVYGWAKLTGELLAHYAVEQYGADVLVYRPFSGYGEDQSFDYPFPSIIRRIVDRENPITIWGSGEQCRDFIHIDDIVEAVMQTKDVLKPGDVLNLGTGIATSFKQLVLAACAATNIRIGTVVSDEAGYKSSLTFECDTTKPEGVFYRVADTYKLSQFYKPRITLEEGIRRVAKHLTEAKKKCSE
ncbi:MAG: NAD(P)-dependent oxidoreductase, partial [Candidatus Sulfotelmatobacter sp.]